MSLKAEPQKVVDHIKEATRDDVILINAVAGSWLERPIYLLR